jgi:CoA:oxalate CoA-transferase
LPIAHPAYASQDGLMTAGVPIQFSQGRTGFDPVLPVAIGQHNAEVYRDLLGYSDDQVRDLAEAGAI